MSSLNAKMNPTELLALPSIFIVGPMGAGKTTIGKQLARVLQRPFYDSDQAIEARTGVTISTIFEIEQEQGFRQRETQMLDELTSQPGIVLATGGGAVVSLENQTYLQRGIILYLFAPFDELYKRTGYDNKRPLLDTDNRAQALQATLALRNPIYAALSHAKFNTKRYHPSIVVKQILNYLKNTHANH